jgi:hypothetical protein
MTRSACGGDETRVFRHEGAGVKTTRYFDEQVLPRRPYIDMAWRAAAPAAPIRREPQPDGRIRHWVKVTPPTDMKTRYLRAVTLNDGATIHNAFFDRDFRDDAP